MKNVVISYGTTCTDSSASLIDITLEDAVNYIRNDKALAQQVKVLRSIRRYSIERYNAMKKTLPFISCSSFTPPRRIQENFKGAYGLIIDIDWPKEPDLEIVSKINRDPRVCLAYISPSGIGNKVVFLFEREVNDAHLYKQIYKAFSGELAHEYHIADVVDFRNCDASRISFLSSDPNVLYNPEPVTIDPDDYIEVQEDSKINEEALINPEAYKSILQKLGTRPRIRKTVPMATPAITKVMPMIEEVLSSYGIIIREKTNIQYGIKIVVGMNGDLGEVNIYHGKKGFSVVSSPRKGSNAMLSEATKRIIESILPLRFK